MTSVHSEIPLPRATARSSRLGSLASLTTATLAERFAVASPPADLAILEGDPECLALLPGAALQHWAASERSPWIGKSFRLDGPDRLVGHNRLRILGGARALAFTAANGRSLLDGRPALILNYDSPGTANPWWQRRIHDELREFEPGLLVGPVTWRGRGRPRTLCWADSVLVRGRNS
jgi:hypothetical protein